MRKPDLPATAALVICYAVLLAALPRVAHAAPRYHIRVDEFGNSILHYSCYELKEERQVDLTGIVLSDDAYSRVEAFGGDYDSVPDLVEMLLAEGRAKLQEPERWNERYRAAEEKARRAGTGIWQKPEPVPKVADEPVDQPAPEPQPEPSATDQETKPVPPRALPVTEWLVSAWGAVARASRWLWTLLVRIWKAVISAGLLGLLLKYLHKRFYIQRRIRLAIIGYAGVGKSVLHDRLLGGPIDRETLLEKKTSGAIQHTRQVKFYRHGKFEIYPEIEDIPGTFFPSIWDRFTGGAHTPHVLVVVLATTMANARNDGKPPVEEKTVDIQLGFVRGCVEGAIGARRTRKPRAIVIFINKFDLFSNHPPEDSTSAGPLAAIKHIMRDHIKHLRDAADKAHIPFEIVVGSALEEWGSKEKVDNKIGELLYGP